MLDEVDGTDEEELDEVDGTDEEELEELDDDEFSATSLLSKLSLDIDFLESLSDDSIINCFFFSRFSVIILYIMNIIYILVILY